MEFSDVARRVFDAYGKHQYELGLEIIEEARSAHRDEDGTLTFWKACLLGRSGHSDEALAVLLSGLDRGLWWDPRILADSDLDSVRLLEGWGELVARSGHAAGRVTAEPPEPRIRSATGPPEGTLVTLHGAGADPIEHAAKWEEAAPEPWTVIAPVGPVPMAPRRWAWPFDLAPESLSEQLEVFDLVRPLVLAGWSQGGGMAASWAWTGGHHVEGLLLIGPGVREEWDPHSHDPVPTYVVVGDGDLNLAACQHLHDRMIKHGLPVFLDVREGLGHEPPEDLQGAISDGLAWIQANQME